MKQKIIRNKHSQKMYSKSSNEVVFTTTRLYTTKPESTLCAVSNLAYSVSDIWDSENALNTPVIQSTKAIHWTTASENYTIK